ncbi:MAG: nitronate monooxygenase, partial [Chlorobium sp.]
MLTSSPTLRYAIKPNCEGLGYLLENGGKCTYIDEYYQALAERKENAPLVVKEKTCLCTGMANYDCWTCGHTTYRLKETTNRLPDGKWQLPKAEDIFHDYQFSTNQAIRLPDQEVT